MTAATYANLGVSAQAAVYSILSQNATVLTYAQRVLDGSATKISRQFSSYVLVHSASLPDEPLTAGRNMRVPVQMDLECFSKSEGTCRLMVDAVRAALTSSLSVLHDAGLRNKRVFSSNVGQVDLPSGNAIDTYHVVVMTLSLTWSGRET